MPTHSTGAERTLKEQYAAENTPSGRRGGLEQAADAGSGPAYSEGPTPDKSALGGLTSAKDSPARKG